jgi:hypothetical protein
MMYTKSLNCNTYLCAVVSFFQNNCYVLFCKHDFFSYTQNDTHMEFLMYVRPKTLHSDGDSNPGSSVSEAIMVYAAPPGKFQDQLIVCKK